MPGRASHPPRARSGPTVRGSAVLRCLVAISVAAATLGATSVPAIAATAASDLSIEDLSFSTSGVDVSGLETRPVTVTVHVTSTAGLPTTNGYLAVTLDRTSGPGPMTNLATSLNLASGDGNDSIWRGVINAPANASGTWTVSTLYTRSVPGASYVVTTSPTFVVNGSHQPRITLVVQPTPVTLTTSSFVIYGRLYDADTGVGIAGVGASYGNATDCSLNVLAGPITTNASGWFTEPAQPGTARFEAFCANVQGPKNTGGVLQPVVSQTVRPQIFVSVTSAFARTVARVGTSIAVTGRTSAYLHGCTAWLQQLHGSTAWRQVDTTSVRFDGTFSLIAKPTIVGGNVFRVYVPACLPASAPYGSFTATSAHNTAVTGT